MRIYIGGQKMRNASGQQAAASKLKMSGSEKIANRNTSNKTFFSLKNGKGMYKKVYCVCKVVFLLLIRLLIFW